MIHAHVRTIFKSGNDMEYSADMSERRYRTRDLLHIAAPTSALLGLTNTETGNKNLSFVRFIIQYQEVATYFPFMTIFRLIQYLEDTKYCTAYSPASLMFDSRHK
jgi:hypothetical protein